MSGGIFGALSSASAQFSASGMSHLDPQMSDNARVALGLPSGTLPQVDTGVQTVLKCAGDYTKMPYGWRQSPFMGQCGFKIQLNKFYSATSPCYPIQDLSCMGALEKKAWANMCKTEFPCKPFVWPKADRVINPNEHSAEIAWLDAILSALPSVLGVSLAGCLLGRSMATGVRKTSNKADVSNDDTDSD